MMYNTTDFQISLQKGYRTISLKPGKHRLKRAPKDRDGRNMFSGIATWDDENDGTVSGIRFTSRFGCGDAMWESHKLTSDPRDWPDVDDTTTPLLVSRDVARWLTHPMSDFTWSSGVFTVKASSRVEDEGEVWYLTLDKWL